MALADTVTNLGNAIINIFDARIAKAIEEHSAEEEKAISEVKAKIDSLL